MLVSAARKEVVRRRRSLTRAQHVTSAGHAPEYYGSEGNCDSPVTQGISCPAQPRFGPRWGSNARTSPYGLAPATLRATTAQWTEGHRTDPSKPIPVSDATGTCVSVNINGSPDVLHTAEALVTTATIASIMVGLFFFSTQTYNALRCCSSVQCRGRFCQGRVRSVHGALSTTQRSAALVSAILVFSEIKIDSASSRTKAWGWRDAPGCATNRCMEARACQPLVFQPMCRCT